MIEVNGLTKIYGGSVPAVDNLSFRIANGKVYGLLGRNGAGKSTTMNMITGCLVPTCGSVKINGYDISERPLEAKRCIGYLPETPPLYDDMTPEEYLTFVAEAKGVHGKAAVGAAVREVMQETGIVSMRSRLIRNLSKGYRQRVGIAMTMLGNPDIIILDEPTVGLDPQQIVEIRGLIRKLGETKTVILSSHILTEISELCDEVLILSRGKLVACDTIEALEKRSSGGNTLSVTVKGEERTALAAIRGVEGVLTCRTVSKRGGTLTVEVRPKTGADIRDDVFFALASSRCVVLSTEMRSPGLEEVFLSLTKDNKASAASSRPDDESLSEDAEDSEYPDMPPEEGVEYIDEDEKGGKCR